MQKQRSVPVFLPSFPAIYPLHSSLPKILAWVYIQDIQPCHMHGLPVCKWLYKMLLIPEFVYSLFYWELSSGNVTSPPDWHGTGPACELDPSRSKEPNTNQQLSIPETGTLPKERWRKKCPLGLEWIIVHGLQDLLQAPVNPALLTTVGSFTCSHSVRFTAVKFKN